MLCQRSQRIFNTVNIELFVNINNPRRDTTYSCSISSLVSGGSSPSELPLSSRYAHWYKPEMAAEVISPRTWRHSHSCNLKVKVERLLLWGYYLPLWWSGTNGKLIWSPEPVSVCVSVCVCVCVSVFKAMLKTVQLIDISSEPWAERSPSVRWKAGLTEEGLSLDEHRQCIRGDQMRK